MITLRGYSIWKFQITATRHPIEILKSIGLYILFTRDQYKKIRISRAEKQEEKTNNSRVASPPFSTLYVAFYFSPSLIAFQESWGNFFVLVAVDLY